MIPSNVQQLFAVDPGKSQAGVASFWKGRLVGGASPRRYFTQGLYQVREIGEEIASSIKELRRGRCARVDTMLAIEQMAPRKERVNDLKLTEDLLFLSAVSGYVLANVTAAHYEWVNPRWTGGRGKAVNHPRIISRLDPEEKAVLDEWLAHTRADQHKEALDAVGIGLFLLKRL